MASSLKTVRMIGSIILVCTGDHTMKWEKPAFREFRLGFEVTMYVMHR